MTDFSRRRLLAACTLLAASPLLASCGFRLTGPQPMAFSTIHLGISPHSELGALLARRIRASGSTAVVEDPAQAEVRLQILRNTYSREILSLTGDGKVREYELTRELGFQLVDSKGTVLIEPTLLTTRRDYTFDDARILAKEQEEALLLRDMQDGLARQLVRRLAAVQM